MLIQNARSLDRLGVQAGAPTDQIDGGLGDLIHRKARIQFDPDRFDADHEAAVATVSQRISAETPRAKVLQDVKRRDMKRRRQLTVRVDMARFGQLDRLAKSTGRTYQDIQARALDGYFEVFPVKIGRIGMPVNPCFVKRGPAKRRRQLTVRIDMARFAQLDYLAKSTGQTYQAILSRAIDRYLWAYPVVFIRGSQRESCVESNSWEPVRHKDVTPQRQTRQAQAVLADLITRANFTTRPRALLGARTA
jgi:predicted transcriptional regulator